ncbi:Asp-tRNA(Asn)/Glu-tRNA(Gln) amidotransferase subunit GatC [Pedobacter chitinilyticus]|uniref:Aspartyl/glutamyl-tRNA(Asn/Gln) amidotransferase subunit C n=1 Tax=Pedobacter chitinilyticus TaxID=2233776 RepID=A0A443Z1T6_9SPHI|nr:Asp-tRNA(Asn)/Glu-tRNA(Gln) amidotransferase subunit GatC [Pedobacter chitinilyticus]RWU10449.1 Asp-tRNA(Asn)/Glu-tRNA(Gln) amidotransferase subunit GatC [Pedobacter chitinilyticus]
MVIDKQTVHKVADLARIEIKDNEVENLTKEMNKILTFMEKLNELDTDGVKPLVYMNEEANVWREDVAKNEISVKDGLKNAALHNERFFMVPKIIEK